MELDRIGSKSYPDLGSTDNIEPSADSAADSPRDIVTLTTDSGELGHIFYPNEHDLKSQIKLFDALNNDNDDSKTTDDDALKSNEYIHSLLHDRSCQIEFENGSSANNIYCFWIQYDSNITAEPHIIEPSAALRLNTYLTHPFIISTSETLSVDNYDSIIAVYIPTNSNHTINHVLIEEDLKTITVNAFGEEIKPRCKCGRLLKEMNFDANNPENEIDECLGCERYISDGDRVWYCDNTDVHRFKLYCLQCAQQRYSIMYTHAVQTKARIFYSDLIHWR